ncbi:TSCPD domain-containing protein [Treponema sp.]
MDIDEDVVKNIEFMGGCNGNSKTIRCFGMDCRPD